MVSNRSEVLVLRRGEKHVGGETLHFHFKVAYHNALDEDVLDTGLEAEEAELVVQSCKVEVLRPRVTLDSKAI